MKIKKFVEKIENIPSLYLYTALFLIGFIVYTNSLFNGFVWDDEEQIVNNAIIQNFSNIGQTFSGATFGTGGGSLSGWFFRPFLTFSYMVIYAIFGQNAFGFHLFQVVFHILNAFLIFKILTKLLPSSKHRLHTFVSFVASVLFIVHPAITEAVSYIASLSEVMYTFFDLLAFYLIIKTDPKTKNIIIISLLLFGATLFKESSIIMLPILISYILFYKLENWRRWIITIVIPFIAYFFVRLILINIPIRHPEFAPISEASLLIRIATIPKELFSYLQVIFYPNKLSISQHFLVTSFKSLDFYIPLLLDLLFISFILILSWKLKSKIIIFGLTWFLLGFGLVSNIFPLDMTIAERWLYFPFVGFIFILAGILYEASTKLKSRALLLMLFILLLIIPFGIRTIVRNSNWSDGLTLYSHDEKISPNSFDLENNLGVELFRAGKIDQAKIHFEKSIKLQPKWYFTYNNLGAVYERRGNLKEAKKLYEKTLSLSDYYLAYENLAGIMLKTEKPKTTIAFTENALKKLPYNANLNKIMAIAYFEKGATDSAKLYAQRAYALSPSEENYQVLQKILSN